MCYTKTIELDLDKTIEQAREELAKHYYLYGNSPNDDYNNFEKGFIMALSMVFEELPQIIVDEIDCI